MLLLLFLIDKGHLCVALSWLPPEEVVDLGVGLRDHLLCPGSASFVTSWHLLLSWSVYQRGQISGGEVGELDCKLGILQDAVSQDLLVPESDVGVALQYLSVLTNVRAADELTAGSNVLEVEEATIFMTCIQVQSECWCCP